mmetsp:Transcript_73956/g.143006  ORF Transcript_73956/g.143006 Transcript_73956/m.143006 type:complete len:200 (-) Transcript_73956:413-1012(-)
MANISCRQVCRFHEVVIEDVVPVCQRDEDCSATKVGKGTSGIAEAVGVSVGEERFDGSRTSAVAGEEHGIVAGVWGWQPAVVIHGREVGDVQEHPPGEARPRVPEALQVERDLEAAAEEPRVADHTHKKIIPEVLQAENAPILLKLLIANVALPQQPKVNIKPKGHQVACDDGFGEQGSHVKEDIVRLDDAKITRQDNT